MKQSINTIYNKNVFSAIFLLFFSTTLFAKNVPLEKAKQVAINVFSENSGLSKKSLEIKNFIPVKNGDLVLYRVFNFHPKGYVIISADDSAEPIIGYGLSANFSFDNAPPALLYLLSEYKKEMNYIIKNKLIADNKITSKWNKYINNNYIPTKSYSVGTCLLETTWGQGSPFNDSVPEDPNNRD